VYSNVKSFDGVWKDLSGQGAFADFKWFDYREEIDGEVDP